jgi:hypothetical protein
MVRHLRRRGLILVEDDGEAPDDPEGHRAALRRVATLFLPLGTETGRCIQAGAPFFAEPLLRSEGRESYSLSVSFFASELVILIGKQIGNHPLALLETDLLRNYCFCKIARTIHFPALEHGSVVGKQL